MHNKYFKYGFMLAIILIVGSMEIQSITSKSLIHVSAASKKPSRSEVKYVSKNMPISELDDLNKQWISSFNSLAKGITNYYIKEALMVEKDNYLQGVEQLGNALKKKAKSSKITIFTVEYRAQLTENTDKVYEAGSFTTDTNKTYQFLFIWTKTKGKWKHELDSITLKDKNISLDRKVTAARKNWVSLANKHSALNLAKKLYQKNFIYYNRGSIYTDYESLAAVYSYMNDSYYNVNLSKEYCIMLQTDYALDIGNWTANGTSGKYIILWKRVNGKWKIRLDTNW